MPAPMSQRAWQALNASTDTLLGVTERMEKSRRLMRDQMFELNAGAAQTKNQFQDRPGNWLVALSAIPVLGPLISEAAGWWADHPLRAVAELFARPSGRTTEPLTQRHPWAMLIGAAAVGGLLMWTRPWRFALLRRAVYSGLLPQVVSSLLSCLPTDGLLNLVRSVWRGPAEGKAPPTTGFSVKQAPACGGVPPSTLH
ncbi:MAG: hypothetical protein CFE40_04000 [Burkholderiales bacterium PBB1]|nr:MAG: hypothetical protein CFE40_04000 [Burkholderiales bacterium PBB1]